MICSEQTNNSYPIDIAGEDTYCRLITCKLKNFEVYSLLVCDEHLTKV